MSKTGRMLLSKPLTSTSKHLLSLALIQSCLMTCIQDSYKSLDWDTSKPLALLPPGSDQDMVLRQKTQMLCGPVIGEIRKLESMELDSRAQL